MGEKGVTMAHYTPADVYEATMSYTFKNLDAKLNADTKSMEVAEDDIQKRKERSELLHKKREVERMRERNELNEFLKEHARFYGKDPDPSQAYPMQRKRDLYQEEGLKNKLKDALDTQVQEKQAKLMENRRQEVQEDRFFVDCVGQALKDDRIYRHEKVQAEKSMLTQSWDQQKTYANRMKTLDRRFEGFGS